MTTMTAPPMVRSVNDLIGYPIDSSEGDKIGRVKDFLYDDDLLTIRYMVADTGGWLTSHRTLVSPLHLLDPDVGWDSKHFPVNLTRDQVRNSPELNFDQPVSRQYEEAFAEYYSLSPYWTESAMIGYASPPPSPRDLIDSPEAAAGAAVQNISGDPHLRSFNETRNYSISAMDGEIGYLDDLILECGTWRLRYVIVNIHRWIPGGRVMFDIDWLENIDYIDRKATLDLTKQQIEAGPKYDPNDLVNEDAQRNLYDYYGKPAPWEAPLYTPF